MSALQKVREKFGNLAEATDRTDRSPSVSSVSAILRKVEKLDPALADRIRQMGARWQYSTEELAEALEAASADRAGWLAAVEWDEALHEKARRAQMLVS